LYDCFEVANTALARVAHYRTMRVLWQCGLALPTNAVMVSRQIMNIRRSLKLLALAWLGWLIAPAPGAAQLSYARDIRPLLAARCFACHNATKMSGGLRLDDDASLRRSPLVVPGNAAASRLYQRLTAAAGEQMPPAGERLTSEQIALFKTWIDAGAILDRETERLRDAENKTAPHWAWQPIQNVAVPKLRIPHSALRTSLDAFIAQRLRQAGLRMSPAADRRTLIRRLYFDLIGLPPAPERVRQFVNDRDPRAYEKLVDELLASPRYGERWARHWLDVVHYGDTHGYDKDKPRPHAWPYRDYVIRAFNEDKPYARFVEEQIAGDVLYPATRDGIVALGFIAAGPWDFIGHAELPESKIDGKIARHLDRDDMVANTIGTFNSVTVHCAQCHDHKFDPITQQDYYSLQAVFAALDRADKKYFSGDPTLTQQFNQLDGRQRDLAERKRIIERDAAKATGLAKPDAQAIDAAMKPDKRAERDAYAAELAQLNAQLARFPKPEIVYAGTVHYGTGTFTGTGANGGKPRPVYVLARGQVITPRHEAAPGALAMLSFQPARFALPNNAPETARRAALARWLTDKNNPLTWRSIVNRVWQYHFGTGLVATPNDFGLNGARPSHPELLDWLAAEFRDTGGSLKKLHKLIVMSATYRQTSQPATDHRPPTTDNQLLWHQNRRKLEAEAARDAVLSITGKLDLTMGGPGWQDFVIERPEHSPHYEYGLADPNDAKTWRRSIYRFIVRSQTQPWMTALDCADPSMRVDKRNESLSPLQALALLNNGFMVTQAQHFAARLEKEFPHDLPRQIVRAHGLAFARAPNQAELQKYLAFAQQHGLPNLCRALLNMNEFTFVD
jgi:mono/diheme cytochrome c family protein